VTRLDKNKIQCILFICIFFFAVEVCTSGEAESVALQEAKLGREAAERKAVQLEMELERTKKSLEQIRERYATLYLDSHAKVQKLRQTELQLANLWHNRDGDSVQGLVDRLLAALETAGSRQLEVAGALERVETSFKAYLSAGDGAKQAVLQELKHNLASLRTAVEGSLRPLAGVNALKSGKTVEARRGIRVVAVDEKMQVVLADAGSLAGVMPDSRWCLMRDDKLIARLLAVQVRMDLSALVITDGDLAEVPIGCVLLPAERFAVQKRLE